MIPDSLPEGTPAHVGTTDLDLGLKLALLDEGRYHAFTKRLRDAGFTQDQTEEAIGSGGASAVPDRLPWTSL